MRGSWIVASLSLATACAGGEPQEDMEATTEAELATELVATVEGLSRPEAVKYDAEQDVYFVSNFGPQTDDNRDGNGFMSRVGAEGEIETLRFFEGSEEEPLHMPRGMALLGDTLWVADVDGVHAFHRQTGEALGFVDFRALEPGFLNDVDTDAAGTLHVTDSQLGRVYRVVDGTAEIAVEDERTGPPNGITWDPTRQAFLLGTWGGEQMLRSWSPETGFSEVVTIPGGNFDGIEVVNDRIVVASQTDSTLWVVEGTTPTPATRVQGRPADIAVDPSRGRVAIPYIDLNLVEIWHVVELGGS